MKILNFLMALGLVMVAAAVTVATQNPLMGLAAASLTAVAVEQLFGFSLVDLGGSLNLLAITGLKRKAQTLTIGGAKRLFLALTEDIANEFLTYELAKSTGEYSGAIPLGDG